MSMWAWTSGGPACSSRPHRGWRAGSVPCAGAGRLRHRARSGTKCSAARAAAGCGEPRGRIAARGPPSQRTATRRNRGSGACVVHPGSPCVYDSRRCRLPFVHAVGAPPPGSAHRGRGRGRGGAAAAGRCHRGNGESQAGSAAKDRPWRARISDGVEVCVATARRSCASCARVEAASDDTGGAVDVVYGYGCTRVSAPL